MNEEFLEGNDIIMAIVPVDLQTAANDGDWVSMRNYQRCLAVLIKAIGTAGDDPVFTLKQATDAGGTGSKNLTFTKIRKKVGTQTGIGAWTTVTQSAGTSYTDTVSAEAQTIMAVEIKASDLDVANGFYFIQLSIPDVGGNAQLGCGIYIMLGGTYKRATPISAIA